MEVFDKKIEHLLERSPAIKTILNCAKEIKEIFIIGDRLVKFTATLIFMLIGYQICKKTQFLTELPNMKKLIELDSEYVLNLEKVFDFVSLIIPETTKGKNTLKIK